MTEVQIVDEEPMVMFPEMKKVQAGWVQRESYGLQMTWYLG